MEVVKLDEGRQGNLLEKLELLKARVLAGETVGLMVIEECRDGYSFQRVHMQIETGLALLCRALHHTQADWDAKMGK